MWMIKLLWMCSWMFSLPFMQETGGWNGTREVKKDIWKTLMSVQYGYDKNAYVPQFNKDIKELDGKIVTVRGYMYPIEEKLYHKFFMLSYYPVSVCFFCGGAGPESIIEVSGKKGIKLSDKAVKLRGKLRLNYNDRNRLFFILLHAEVVR